MKKIICSFLLVNMVLFSAFEDSLEGVEVKGIGGLKTANVSPSAVNFNPALSPFIGSISFGIHSSFETLYSEHGRGLGFTAYGAFPLIKDKLSLNGGLDFFSLGGIDFPGLNGGLYKEIKVLAGAGFAPVPKLALGLNLKMQFWRTGAESGANAGNDFNLGFGMAVNDLLDVLTVGLTADNLLVKDVASGDSSFEEKLPVNISAGVMADSGDKLKVNLKGGADFSLAVPGTEINLNLGAGIGLLDSYRLRFSLGLIAGQSYGKPVPAFGASYSFTPLTIHYAFQYPVALPGTSGQHYLGLELQLGSKGSGTAEKAEQAAPPEETEAPDNIEEGTAAENKYPVEFRKDDVRYAGCEQNITTAWSFLKQKFYFEGMKNLIKVFNLSPYHKEGRELLEDIYPELKPEEKTKVRGLMKKIIIKYRTTDPEKSKGYQELYDLLADL